MKKYLGIVCALVLAVSLLMVPAAVSADTSSIQFKTDGIATAVWTTEAFHTGSYSAKLTATTPDSAGVGIPYGGPLSAITGLSFWYNHEDYNPGTGHILGPDMVLVLFDGPTTYIAGTGGAVESIGEWREADAKLGTNLTPSGAGEEIWWYGTMSGITFMPLGAGLTFNGLQGALQNAQVLYVGVNLEPPDGSGAVYVDDITVNGETYDFEPD